METTVVLNHAGGYVDEVVSLNHQSGKWEVVEKCLNPETDEYERNERQPVMEFDTPIDALMFVAKEKFGWPVPVYAE